MQCNSKEWPLKFESMYICIATYDKTASCSDKLAWELIATHPVIMSEKVITSWPLIPIYTNKILTFPTRHCPYQIEVHSIWNKTTSNTRPSTPLHSTPVPLPLQIQSFSQASSSEMESFKILYITCLNIMWRESYIMFPYLKNIWFHKGPFQKSSMRHFVVGRYYALQKASFVVL